MRAARLIFAVAGVYGLIVLLPLFFAEPWLEPPPSRPEDYYGFLGAAAAMQLVYLTIARNPFRYRALMPIGALAKLSFFATILVLVLQGRTSVPALLLAGIDGLIGFAFLFAWHRSASEAQRRQAG